MKRIFLAGIVILGGILINGWFARPALAYTVEHLSNMIVAGDFAVGPGKAELYLQPGESATEKLVVTNRYGEDMDFKLDLEDFKGSSNPEQGLEFLGLTAGPYSLKDFIQMDVATFTLKHGDRITIPVKVSIPPDAVPGGLYAAVMVMNQPKQPTTTTEEGKAKSGLTVVSRIASLFFVRVAGDVKMDALLKDFSIEKKYYLSNTPVNFKLSYENKGSVYVNPYGTVDVKNIYGMTVDQLTFGPTYVLPASERLFKLKLDRPFMFGRYRADLTAYRGYGGMTETRSIIFWVLPWKILLAFVIGLLLVIYIIKSSIGWLRKNFEYVGGKNKQNKQG